MPIISNHTYEEITIGQTEEYSKSVEERDIQLFAAVSGDVNPVHLDPAFAARTSFGERIAHGMLTGALVSAALAMKLPGPGTIYVSQSLRFRQPVKIGDLITVSLEVKSKEDRRRTVTLDCRARNEAGKIVAQGEAQVIPAGEKITVETAALPEIRVD